jgi:hypothetical protein
MGVKRPRYAGSIQQLADANGAVAKGRSSCRYDEVRTTASAKTDAAAIEDHIGLLSTLHQLQPSLVFKKSDLKQAVELLLSQKAGLSWAIAEQHREGYVETMCNRLSNMCRRVNQACAKKTSWTRAPTLPKAKFAAQLAQAVHSNAVDPRSAIGQRFNRASRRRRSRRTAS